MKSIYKILAEEDKRNEVQRDFKDMFGSALGIGAAGYTGKKMLSGSNADLFSSATSTVGEILGSKQREKSPTAQVGSMLKKSVDQSFARRQERDIVSSKSFFDSLISSGKKTLEKTVNGALEAGATKPKEEIASAINNEKIALLISLRDSINEIGGMADQSSRMEVVSKIDSILQDLDTSPQLSSELEEVLTNIRDTVPDEMRVKEMHRFRAMQENSRYFSGKSKAMDVSASFKKPTYEATSATEAFDIAYRISSGKGALNNEGRFVENKNMPEGMKKLRERLIEQAKKFDSELNKYGGRVGSYTIVPEHQGKLPSIYMKPQGAMKNELGNVLLFASNVGQNQRSVARFTKELATPSNVPSAVLSLDDIKYLTSQRRSLEEVSGMIFNRNIARFDQKTFLDMVASAGSVDDLNMREHIGKRYAMLRSVGENANIGLYGQEATHKMNMGKSLAENLSFTQLIGSNKMFVHDPTGRTSSEELQKYPTVLQRMYPELFEAPASQDVMVRESQLYDGRVNKFFTVNLIGMRNQDGTDKLRITPFTLLNTLGTKNRLTTPLTARELQIFGREEIISNIYGIGEDRRTYEGSLRNRDSFGRKKNIPLMASNEKLLSVNEEAIASLKGMTGVGRLHGANLGAFMLLEEPMERLMGLEEGAAYFGGKFETSFAINKTVYDPDTMQRPEFAFLRDLIDRRLAYEKGDKTRGRKPTLILKKPEEIDAFFKRFSTGEDGVIVGEIDNRLSMLRRFKGLTKLEIGIEDIVEKDKKLIQYRLTGDVTLDAERLKLFSVLGRVTGERGGPINFDQMAEMLERGLASDLTEYESEARITGSEMLDIYRKEFGGVEKSTIITGEGMIKRGSDFTIDFMHGGARMLGVERATMDKAIKEIGADTHEGVLEYLKKLYPESKNVYTNQYNRAKNLMVIEVLMKATLEDVSDISGEALGLLFNPLRVREKATEETAKNEFGLLKGDTLEAMKRGGLKENMMEGVMRGFKSMLSIGAASVFAGTADAMYGRNMAKFEPRTMSYLHFNLRKFFGMNSEQATNALTDFTLRQEGIEFSGKFLPDVFNLASSPTSDPRSLVESFSELKKLSFDEFLSAGQKAQEIVAEGIDPEAFRRGLMEVSSESKPSVLDLKMFKDILGEEEYAAVKKIIPSETLLIPSSDSLKNMAGYKVRKGEGMQNIDSAIIANLKSMFGSLYMMANKGGDSTREIQRIRNAVKENFEVGASALRRSLSGSVMGSSTSQGSGLILDKSMLAANANMEEVDHALKVMKQEKGYAFFSNVGGFVDSIASFIGGAKKLGMTELEVEEEVATKFRNFMYQGVDKSEKVKVGREMALRNPQITTSNFAFGIAMGRYDIAKEVELLPLLRNQDKQFLYEGVLSKERIQSGLTSSNTKEREFYQELKNRNRIVGYEFVQKEDSELTKRERKRIQEGKINVEDVKKKVELSQDEALRRINTDQSVFLEAKMTERDLFRLEEFFKESDDEFGNLGGRRRYEQQVKSFNRNQEKFFGSQQYSIGMSSSVEQIESTIKQIESQEYAFEGQLTKKLKGMLNIRQEGSDYIGRRMNRLITKGILGEYGKVDGVGAGELIIPTFDAEVTLSNGQKFNSRIDLAYGFIGDWDADIYQRFHMNEKVIKSLEAMPDFELRKSAMMVNNIRFSVMRNAVSESLDKFALKLGSNKQEMQSFIADQAKKEQVLKGVGPVDVEIKSLLTAGMDMALRESASNPAEASKSIQVGESFFKMLDYLDVLDATSGLGMSQEMGVIKVKKRPKALDVAKDIREAISLGTKTGDTRKFEQVMKTLITDQLDMFSKEAKITDIKVQGLPEGIIDEAIEGVKQTKSIGEELIAFGSAAIRHAHKHGFGSIVSERRIEQAMSNKRGLNSQIFMQSIRDGSFMETSLLGDLDVTKLEHRESAIDRIAELMERGSQGLNRRSGIARSNISGSKAVGLALGALGASYALSSGYAAEALAGPDLFSDVAVKEKIGGRQLYNSFSNQSKDVGASSLQHPTNLYERPINIKETQMVKNTSYNMSGQVGHVNTARQVLNTVVASGGRGHLTVRDDVLPRPNLADYYLRD